MQDKRSGTEPPVGARSTEIPPPPPEPVPGEGLQVLTADARNLIQEEAQIAMQTILRDLGEKLGPLFRYRAEERLDRAVNEVHLMVQPLTEQLGQRLAEVDLHLRTNARDTHLSSEEMKKARLETGAELAAMRGSMDEQLCAMREEVRVALASFPRIDALRLERITFWQILGAICVGGAGVTVGVMVANNRHDKVVRDALIDASW